MEYKLVSFTDKQMNETIKRLNNLKCKLQNKDEVLEEVKKENPEPKIKTYTINIKY